MSLKKDKGREHSRKNETQLAQPATEHRLLYQILHCIIHELRLLCETFRSVITSLRDCPHRNCVRSLTQFDGLTTHVAVEEYTDYKRRMDKLAMAILSITLLFTIYRIAFVSHSPSNPFFIYLTLTLSALGTIRARDFNDPPSIRIMARSSTDHNDHSASLDDQVDTTKSALEAQGARVEDVVRRVESGNTMDRESLSDFLDDVKTDDTLDGLGLMEVDRLTRADPFETIRFYAHPDIS